MGDMRFKNPDGSLGLRLTTSRAIPSLVRVGLTPPSSGILCAADLTVSAPKLGNLKIPEARSAYSLFSYIVVLVRIRLQTIFSGVLRHRWGRVNGHLWRRG